MKPLIFHCLETPLPQRKRFQSKENIFHTLKKYQQEKINKTYTDTKWQCKCSEDQIVTECRAHKVGQNLHTNPKQLYKSAYLQICKEISRLRYSQICHLAEVHVSSSFLLCLHMVDSLASLQDRFHKGVNANISNPICRTKA